MGLRASVSSPRSCHSERRPFPSPLSSAGDPDRRVGDWLDGGRGNHHQCCHSRNHAAVLYQCRGCPVVVHGLSGGDGHHHVAGCVVRAALRPAAYLCRSAGAIQSRITRWWPGRQHATADLSTYCPGRDIGSDPATGPGSDFSCFHALGEGASHVSFRVGRGVGTRHRAGARRLPGRPGDLASHLLCHFAPMCNRHFPKLALSP